MGFTPQQVNHMSMWQFMSAIRGWAEANSSKNHNSLSDDESDELFDMVTAGESGRVLKSKVYWWDESGPVLRGEVEFIV